MAYTEELKEYLSAYDAAVRELQSKKKMFDGLLGMGNHPGSAACHEILDKQIAELCGKAAEAPDGEAAELVRAIFLAEKNWQGPEYARLMLVASQRHTIPLIPLLPEADRQELCAWYEKAYPRRLRLPAQDEVLKALTGEKTGSRSRSWWKRGKS